MNNAYIKKYQETSLAKVGYKIDLTNKLLSLSNNQKFIDFFLRHPMLISLIQKFYPLDDELLNNFKWNWVGLSSNPYLCWSKNLIDKYSDKWNWYSLVKNTGIKWTLNLIENYEERGFLCLSDFSNSKALLLTEDLINKKEAEQEWYWDWQELSYNPSLSWSIQFFKNHLDKWDFGCNGLSSNPNLPWTESLINQFRDEWDWECLSRNIGLPWDIDFIENFIKEWDFLGLMGNNGISQELNPVVKMINLRSTDSVHRFKTYSNKFKNINYWIDSYRANKLEDNWFELSNNIHVLWTPEILRFYRLNWGWHGLSENIALPWSLEFIELYKHMWDYRIISSNKYIWDKVFRPFMNRDIVIEILNNSKL